ncbi:hypothetical protein [Pontimicrobium aquaticum]|uniref:Uncharacterized protein n=1 Tax=Pontimicrobium aquaticum TaxID=2565367 RepID=A0A4U0EUC5_9FLAO|nr:hypothetical protein [Pontimicrobium aquaticum]TJY34834.1 hypothetical protein E5167_11055 [Pontimicrobium aquaticum]
MNIFKKEFKIVASSIVLGLLILATSIMVILFYKGMFDSSPKTEIIIAGLITGLFVAIIQMIMQWSSFRADEKINSLKIIDVLDNRDDRLFYHDFIFRAKNKIDIMGSTAKRFFEHFADEEADAQDQSKVLFNRLERGVKVRILLPQKKYIALNKRNDVDSVNDILVRLSEKYTNLEFKYFSHEPIHSIFRIDDKSIIGPTFNNVSSKNTPGIYIKNNSPLAKKYNEYFQEEWDKGSLEK